MQKKLEFTFDKIRVKLGPLQLGPFDVDVSKKSSDKAPKLPFFIFFYADDEIACAQGKGGGLALWTKAEGPWMLQTGIE